MKLIFLDFDGVLLTGIYREYRHGFASADPKAIANLNRIIRATGAQIVVSSTYRLGSSVQELRKRLNFWGVKGHVVSTTPALYGHTRGWEIQSWIDRWYKHHDEEIESICIIDDIDDMAHMRPYLVMTEHMTGIGKFEVKEAIKMLNHKVYTYEEVEEPTPSKFYRECREDFIETIEYKADKGAYEAENLSGWDQLPLCEVCNNGKALLLHPYKQVDFHGTKVYLMVCKKCHAEAVLEMPEKTVQISK